MDFISYLPNSLSIILFHTPFIISLIPAIIISVTDYNRGFIIQGFNSMFSFTIENENAMNCTIITLVIELLTKLFSLGTLNCFISS